MIQKDSNPVGWALLLYELEDAHEHLANLVNKMNQDPNYDEVDFQINLWHIFSHLNRAWYRRNIVEDISESEWDISSQFPKDLNPT
jgi:hypothetical protein